MSMFLPEQSGQPQAGVAAVTPANPETTQEDVALMQRVLSAAARNPNLMPTDFMAYLADFLQTQRLQVPIGLVSGFTPYANDIQTALTASNAALAAATAAQMKAYADSGASLSLGNNASGTAAGPTLVGLPAGKYVILAAMGSTAGVNGPSLALSTGLTVVQNPVEQLITFVSTTTITSTISGTGGGAGGTVGNCWILALNYSN